MNAFFQQEIKLDLPMSGEIKLCITNKFSIEDQTLKVTHSKVPG